MSIPKQDLHRLIDALPEQEIIKAKKYLERLLKNNQPMSAADPRPSNKPYYINPFCPKCGTSLILVDLLENPSAKEKEIWHDEFICPLCRDDIFMDWPESEWEDIRKTRQAATEGESLNEIARKYWNMFRVILTKQAQKDLDKLNQSIRERILKVLYNNRRCYCNILI